MSAVRALFAAPGPCQALMDGNAGAVELVLSRGAYIRLGGDWILLADPAVPFGPLSLSIDGLDRLGISPGLPVRVVAGRLTLGDHAVSLERMRARRMASLHGAPARASAITAAAGAALAALPDSPAHLRSGIQALAAGRLGDAAHSLAGLGAGLTPAGDDVLAGYAAASIALGTPGGSDRTDAAPLSTLAAGRSSPLGLAYLRCAEQGELPDGGARLLAAIRRGSISAMRAALPPLRSWGASSGTALAWGMAAAVRSCMNA